MTRGLTTLTLWLPAVFWLTYSLWNAIWAEPPRIGPISAIAVQYVLMLPAAAALLVQVLVRRGARQMFPGQWAYAAFLGWVAIGLVWFGPSGAAEPAKTFVVYGLLGLTAAQVIGAGDRAMRVFAAGLILTATIYAVWTVSYALATRFAYRSGVPVNPNFVSTLVAPGMLAALVLALAGSRGKIAFAGLAALQLYACLLLGSRGVVLAIAGGVVVVMLRLRPGWAGARARWFVAVAGAVLILAQAPAVPDAIWMTAQSQWHDLTTSLARQRNARARGDGPYLPGSGGYPPGQMPSPPTPPPEQTGGNRSAERGVPPPLLSAGSTALARFGEDRVTSINLRGQLWVAAFDYLRSGIRPMLIGGGLGMSQVVAHEANPVFANMHNIVLQVLVDFGLVGLALFGLLHWQIGRHLYRRNSWNSHMMLALMAFFLIDGLTASVIDLHLYWVFLGVAAGAHQLES